MSSPYQITSEMVDDILTAALEGGVTYWTDSVVPATPVPDWVKSTLFPGEAPFVSELLTKGFDLVWTESEGGAVHTLTLAKLKKGIRKAAEHYGLTPARFHEEHDAEYADVACQFALLGEIVYG